MMLFDDIEGGVLLAEAALRADPMNMLARQAHAVTRGAFGQPQEAYALSARCQAAVSQDELRHIWDLYHSLVCISSGRLTKPSRPPKAHPYAVRISWRRAGKRLPWPQWRMITLPQRGTAGNWSGWSLRFTLDRMVRDETYPVSTLRRAGALNFSSDDVQD